MKKEAEGVFDELGVSTSYAVSMFLKQVVLERRIPFEIALPDEEEARRTEEFAIAFNCMGGKNMPESLKPILHLYAKGTIDYETACLIVSRKFQGSKL
ncbi:MAG: type II toxin-antitoxin system RelB/DinJ family antitoxin [Candidatus Enteromonas sp.]